MIKMNGELGHPSGGRFDNSLPLKSRDVLAEDMQAPRD